MNNYIVKEGETITDVVLNTTGSIDNWNAILEANSFTDWVPSLIAGQSIIIPDTVVIQTNVLREMQIYPACNNSGINNLQTQIDELISRLSKPTKLFEDENEFIFEDGVDYIYENG